jgi:hypothetical protein
MYVANQDYSTLTTSWTAFEIVPMILKILCELIYTYPSYADFKTVAVLN